MAERSVPSTFRAVDSVMVDGSVGRWLHGHGLKTLIDDEAFLAGRCLKRLVNKAWDIVGTNAELYDTLLVTPASIWTVVLPPIPVFVSSTVDRARVRIYASVENTKTSRLCAVSLGRPMQNFPSTDSAVLAMAGDGAVKEYPESGNYFLPLRPGSDGLEWISVLARGDDNTAAAAPQDTGTVNGIFGTRLESNAGPNFGNLPDTDDWYVHVETAGGSILMSQRLVVGGFGTTLLFWPPLPDAAIGMNGQTWRVNRGPRIQMGNISIYEEVPTGL